MNRETADLVTQGAAALAMVYYPEIHVDDPDFSLADDVDFVLSDIGEIEDADREALRDLVARVIIDPTAHRESLVQYVYGLVPDEGEPS